MFDIGFSELLVIGVVSLIVVGPKDLPGMFRTVGRYVGKAKGMAREFQRSMEDAADATGLKDVTNDFKEMASGLDDLKDIGNMSKPGVGGVKAAKKNFDKIVAARDSGEPMEEGAKAGAIAADLTDDDPAPKVVEIVEDTPVKPKPKVKPKAKPKAKPKPKPAAKPKPATKPKTKAKPKAKPAGETTS